jgi:hypothetical protein
MLLKGSITACGSSKYAGVCCHQFRRSVVVKGCYTYCMGPAAYDPSAWGNDVPRAWCRGHSAIAGVPASLLVSLPELGEARAAGRTGGTNGGRSGGSGSEV